MPSKAFVSGRAADKNDVDRGRAAFVLDDDGKVVGKPIDIAIPQYGYFRSDNVLVIIIQAERSPDGRSFVGTRTFDGKLMVGLFDDVKLLGTTPRMDK